MTKFLLRFSAVFLPGNHLPPEVLLASISRLIAFAFSFHAHSPSSSSNQTTLASHDQNLQQVYDWANQFGLQYQVAKRDKGAPILVPSVYHWSVGHFAAIVDKKDNKYKLQDTTFDADGYFDLSQRAIEAGSDGYFLVRSGALPDGWHTVSKAEAETVWGKGGAYGWANWSTPFCPKNPGKCSGPFCNLCGSNGGMTQAATWSDSAELNLTDTPLSYKCPIGPAMDFLINYNEVEQNQPTTFNFSNLSSNWSLNWISHLNLDGSNNATVSVRGGGIEIYYNSNGSTPVYTNNVMSQALLIYVSSGVFQRQLPDGSMEVFNLSDGSGHIYLTQIIDSQGNTATISYDANFRVTGVSDANGNKTTFSYVSNTLGNSGFYLISGLADPFGRTASFSYDTTNTYLLSITDAVGIISSYTYEPSGSVIKSLQTPYGLTSFTRYAPMGSYGVVPRGLIFNFPDGTTSRTEAYADETKKTYFWDREAMTLYPNDWQNNVYTHCYQSKWAYNTNGGLEAPVPQYTKQPLEAPIFFTYPGQANSDYLGTSDKPSTTSRLISGANVENAVVAGTITAGDTIFVGIYDTSLNGYYGEVSYTVKTGDTLVSVAAGLAAAITNFPDYYSIGVSATSSGTTLHIVSTSVHTQTFAWRNNSGTETLTFSANSNLPETAGLTGTVTASDLLTLTVTDSGLPSGHESVSYTVVAGDSFGKIATRLAAAINADTNLQTAGISASAGGDVVNILSYSPNATTYSKSTSGGATEVITLGTAAAASVTQTWQKQYNSFGQTTQSIDPIGRTFSYSYATNNIDLLQKTETKGTDSYVMGNWTYNTQHEPTLSIDGSGQQTHTYYNVFGEPITVTDPNSNSTKMTYAGTASATIAGTVTTGNVLTIIVHDSALSGGTTSIPYTVAAGDTLTTIATHLTTNINASTALQTISVSATSAGAVISVKSSSPNGTSYTDTVTGTETIALSAVVNGFLQTVDGPLAGSNDVTSYTWNATGTLLTKTDSEGYVLTYGYDNLDRLLSTTYPDGTADKTTYQNMDPVISTDRLGRATVRTYTPMDQVASETDPLGRQTQYMWCACGSLMMLTDPNSNTTTWNHDLEGRVVQKVYQDGTSISTAYETNTSRVHATTDALQQQTVFAYNTDDTITSKAYSNAVNATSAVTYTYDPNFSRLTNVANGWGTYSYGYNAYITNSTGTPITGGGMLSSVTNNVIANSAISYTYDALGRTTNRSINGSANSDTWGYDGMSRVTSEVNTLGTFNYSYIDDTTGSSKGTTRLKSIAYPNSQVTSFSYYGNTGDERLKQIANLSSTSTVLSQFDYGYDPAGEITQWTQQNSSQSPVQYNNQYDKAGQLVAFNGNFGSGAPSSASRYNYAYDTGANRTAAQKTACWPVKIGGAVTATDTVTVTVSDTALTGGTEAVTYTVASGNTLANIASGLAAAITADTNLQAIGVNAVAHGQTIYIRSCSSNITTLTVSKKSGATETITSGIASNVVENASIGGTITSGDTVTINVLDSGLSGGKVAITYTVASGNTTTTIATGLKTAINANTSLSTLGVTATSVGAVVTIKSTSPNTTTYTSATNAGATETIATTTNFNTTQGMLLRGSITTGNVLTLTVKDGALAGGTEVISYTIPSGATLTSIATAIAAAVNADTNLSAIGISAISSGALVTLASNSVNLTTYLFGKTLNGPETAVISLPVNGTQTAAIGGSKTTGNVLTLIVYDAGLTGGKETVNYTVVAADTLTTIATNLAAAVNDDTNLSGIGVTATGVSTVVNLTSASVNATTYAQSTSSAATEVIVLGPTANVNQYANNNVNELVNYAAGGQTLFQGTTSKPAKSVTVTSQAFQINAAAQPTTTFASAVAGSNTMFVTLNQSSNGSTTATIAGSSVATGAVISIIVDNSKLTGGQITKSYTVSSGNTYTSIAASLASAINADTNFPAIALSATSSGAVLTLTTKSPTYVASTSGGATETVTVGYNNLGATTVAVGGKVTSGDVLTLTTTYAPLSGGSQAVHYTIVSTDTLTTIAAGLIAAVNANTGLTAVGVTATASTPATLSTAQIFSASNMLPSGSSNSTVTAIDGNNSSVANNYQLGITGSASTPLTYDLNGNMTSDGTNTYQWDAENRLIQINYAGSGNNSQFAFDALNKNSKIIEQTGGSVTSTKQFVWSEGVRCEARDASSAITTRYYYLGETVSGTDYFYSKDHLGTTREVTNGSGSLQTQYSYDPCGRVSLAAGSLNADFQYAGYYYHAPSGLNLAVYRGYNANLAKWLSRDPIAGVSSMMSSAPKLLPEVTVGPNLYAYVHNKMTVIADPSGLCDCNNSPPNLLQAQAAILTALRRI